MLRKLTYCAVALVLLGLAGLLEVPQANCALATSCVGGAADQYCGGCCQNHLHDVVYVTGCGEPFGSYCVEETTTKLEEACETGADKCQLSRNFKKCEMNPATGTCGAPVDSWGTVSCCNGSSGSGDPTDTLAGYHEGNSGIQESANCMVTGWAVSYGNTNWKTPIQIYVNGSPVLPWGHTAADYRPDLAAAGVCPGGECAFSFSIFDKVPDAEVSVKVRGQKWGGSWVDLPWYWASQGVPETIHCCKTRLEVSKVLLGTGDQALVKSQNVYVNGEYKGNTANLTVQGLPTDWNTTVSVGVPSGYQVGYTVCYNNSTCHNEANIQWNRSITEVDPPGCLPNVDDYISLRFYYRSPLSRSYRIYAYTTNPSNSPLGNVSFRYSWNGGANQSAATQSNGYTATLSKNGGDAVNFRAAPPSATLTIGGLQYVFDGWVSTSGCTLPSNTSVSGTTLTHGGTNSGSFCLPARFRRVPTNQDFRLTAQAYFLNERDEAVALGGVPVTLRWLRATGNIEQSGTTNDTGSAIGRYTSLRTLLNDVPTQLEVSMPAGTITLGTRQFTFAGYQSITPTCTLPADWPAWTVNNGTARSPGYLIGGNFCLAARYTEVPQDFQASVRLYTRDDLNAIRPISGISVPFVWVRQIPSNPATSVTQNLPATDANGRSSVNRSMVTTTTTRFRYTFPTKITLYGDPQRQATLKGFNFDASDPSCPQPPDWSSWTVDLATGQVTSPAYTSGTVRCIQAEYEEIPQQFALYLQAFYIDANTGMAGSIPGISVTGGYLRVGQTGYWYKTHTTGLMPVGFIFHLLPYTDTQLVASFPDEVRIGNYLYRFREFAASIFGQLPSDWSSWEENTAYGPRAVVSPPYTYATAAQVTARYDRIRLPVINVDPWGENQFYWKARDLPPAGTTPKPLPFLTGKIQSAYPPDTLPGTNTGRLRVTLKTPLGQTYFVYEVPVIATAVTDPDGNHEGTFVLDDNTVRAIEQAATGSFFSHCTLYPNENCFGTTVGQPGSFRGGATSEDQAIGTWTIEYAYTRHDPDGHDYTTEGDLSYNVIWHLTAQP